MVDIQVPTIDAVGGYQQAQANSINAKSAKMQQTKAGLENLGAISLGLMGGEFDGPVNMDNLPAALDMFAQAGMDPKQLDIIRSRPDLIPVLARGSIDTLSQLKLAQDDRDFDLRMQEFQQKVDAAIKGGEETWYGTPGYYKDAQGNIVAGQYSNRGNFRPSAGTEGMTPAIPVQQLNTETGFVPRTKFGDAPAGAPVTPINNEQAAYDTSVGKGKGELEVELPAKRAKAAGALDGLERQWVVVGSDIDRAIQQADNDFPVTGIFSIANAIPGAPGYDLAETLKGIRANIGFDRLQEMRNNSPTGGALGAVSENENQLLQAVNGSLAEGQSKEQLQRNLKRVKALQALVLKERKDAFARDFGGDASMPNSASDSLPDAPANEEADWTDYF